MKPLPLLRVDRCHRHQLLVQPAKLFKTVTSGRIVRRTWSSKCRLVNPSAEINSHYLLYSQSIFYINIKQIESLLYKYITGVQIPVPLSEILLSVLAPAESFYYQSLLLSFLYFTKIYFSLSGFLFSSTGWLCWIKGAIHRDGFLVDNKDSLTITKYLRM